MFKLQPLNVVVVANSQLVTKVCSWVLWCFSRS